MFPARANSDSTIAMCLEGLPAWCHSVTKGAIAVVGLARCSSAAGGAVVSGKVWKVVCFVFVALFAAGCGGGGDDDASAVTLPPVSDDAVVVESSTTTEAPAVSPTTTEAVVLVGTPEEAAAVWQSAWQSAAQIESDPEEIAEFASDEIAMGLQQVLTSGGTSRLVSNFPAVSEPDGSNVFVIHDCLMASPPIIDSGTGWYRGEVSVSDTGQLVVSSFELQGSGCIPELIAAQVLPAFLDARALEAEFLGSDAPDPSVLEPGVTGNRLSFLTNLGAEVLVQQVVRGLDQIEWNPVVTAFTTPMQIEVGACYVVPENHGAFDRTTGARTDLIPPLAPGQRDAETATMTLDQGVWKISDNGGATNLDCQLDSAAQRLPVIGVGGDTAAREES